MNALKNTIAPRKPETMQEYAVNLTDREFRLFQLIRRSDEINKTKDELLDIFIRQIELFSEITDYKPKIKWLQTGDKSRFHPIRPVRPKKGSPLASDILLEQRNGLTEKYQ